MPRSYSVAAAAVAIGAPLRWVDNAVSHHRLAGVAHGGHGRDRRISPHALATLAIARVLVTELGLQLRHALALAEHARAADGRCRVSPRVELVLDLARIEREMAARLVHDAERAAPIRRGRPPAVHPRPHG